MTLQRSRAPLGPGPLYLVLYPMIQKLIVGQYKGRGLGQERSRTVEQPKAVQTLLENPKGVAVVDGQ